MRLLAIGLAGLGIVSTFICGCGAVRYPNYYELSAPSPIARGNEGPPLIQPVAVRQFDAPHFVRSGPFASRESAERLGFYLYDRWTVDPRRSATAAMNGDLQAFGVFQSVGLIDGHSAPECLVTGTIEHLELSFGLGGAAQELASSMQDHLRSMPHMSRQTQPTSSNYP
jgi:hypothetical protein